MKPIISKHPLLTFLFFTFLFSSVFYALIIHTGKIGSGFGMYVTGLMWCPGIAAIITTLLLGRKLSAIGWQWGRAKYQWWSYLIPLLYGLITYILIWFFGWGGFYNKEFVTQVAGSFGFTKLPAAVTIGLYALFMGIFGMAGNAAAALGEEIGWRGFLVPELSKKFNFTGTSFIAGGIWAVWHFPILIFADYNSGTPYWYGLSCFTALVLGISFIFTWFRLKSNSVWTAVILHASHNLFIQSVFTPLTKDTGKTNYYIDEFGIVLPLVCICFAIYFWRRRGELSGIYN